MVGLCERLPSHLIALSASPTQLLVGQMTRLPFHSGYATVFWMHHWTRWLSRLRFWDV